MHSRAEKVDSASTRERDGSRIATNSERIEGAARGGRAAWAKCGASAASVRAPRMRRSRSAAQSGQARAGIFRKDSSLSHDGSMPPSEELAGTSGAGAGPGARRPGRWSTARAAPCEPAAPRGGSVGLLIKRSWASAPYDGC